MSYGWICYAGSIESNLMQMVLAKEKLNLFMKGQDIDLDKIYGMNFYETKMGSIFFNSQLPKLITALQDIASALSKPAHAIRLDGTILTKPAPTIRPDGTASNSVPPI